MFLFLFNRDFFLFFQDIGLKKLLPRIVTLEEGVNVYRSFPNYRKFEQKRGAIAFKIRSK